ncbi:uncharacterized protein [Panulirus ornatus]|uniref:uncharacterized protein n=1 Tax=Panulirus ornatus TaxID=150431 RepID=UPI003A84DC08
MTPQRLTAAVLFFLILLYGSEGQQTPSKVKVYSLQRGAWTKPSIKVYIRYDFPADLGSVSNVSICYRIRLERFADYNIHLSYATSHKDANALLFYNMATQMLAFVNNLEQTLTTTSPLELFPETWNHFCHVLTSGSYTLYWQGKRYGWSSPAEAKYLLTGTLIIGQEQDSMAVDFAASQVLLGDVAQMSFWDRELSVSEVEDMAACRSNIRGNVFSFDTHNVQLAGDVPVDTLLLEDLCRSWPNYLLLPEKRSVSASQAQCQLLNAPMAVPTSNEDNNLLRKILLPFMETCSSTPWKLWLGVTDQDEEGVWVDVNTKKPVEYQNFVLPYPYGGSVENCAAMFPDGAWSDAKCNLKKCSSCEIKPSEFLRLRGLCFEEEHETRFRVGGYVDGRPLFRGFYNLLIMWDKNNAQWLLRNTVNTTLASMSPSDLEEYPLGQKIWTVRHLLCGSHPGANLNLSLSPCTTSHFMCRSGQCIAHRHRCNMRYECSDGSDEDDCDIVNLRGGYRRHLTPPVHAGVSLVVTPNITLSRIMAVDDAEMAVTIEFRVRLTWLDDRLSFSHLESTNKGAVLSDEDIRKIWIPQYRLTNLKGGQMQLLQESVRIATAQNPKLPDFNNVKMDLVYPGADNELTLTRDYIASFTCPFDFSAYPFDIHVCNLNLCLPSIYEDFVQFDVDRKEVAFTGPQELALFSVMNVKYATDSGEHHLSVEYELHSHGSGMVLSMFIPSLFLLGVSWATLFVKWEAFVAREVMSLVTLLVLYMLRFCLMSSIPFTLDIKLIDIWFFFVTSILFINILVHIFIEEEPPPDFTTRNKPLLVRPAGGAVIITPETTQSSHPKFITLYRYIILPGIIIIFNIVFWITLFLVR